MSTGPHDRLRGHTPRPTQEYGPTRAARDDRPSLPAELSQLNEILREALSDVLSQRTASGESMIAARVKVDTQRATRSLKGLAGGLGAALIAALSWGWSQVQSYADGRVAAAAAEAKAEQAHEAAQETASRSQDNTQRLDKLEPKVDDALRKLDVIIGELADDEPRQVKVPPKEKRGGR